MIRRHFIKATSAVLATLGINRKTNCAPCAPSVSDVLDKLDIAAKLEFLCSTQGTDRITLSVHASGTWTLSIENEQYSLEKSHDVSADKLVDGMIREGIEDGCWRDKWEEMVELLLF
jgi:hypothetical protein